MKPHRGGGDKRPPKRPCIEPPPPARDLEDMLRQYLCDMKLLGSERRSEHRITPEEFLDSIEDEVLLRIEVRFQSVWDQCFIASNEDTPVSADDMEGADLSAWRVRVLPLVAPALRRCADRGNVDVLLPIGIEWNEVRQTPDGPEWSVQSHMSLLYFNLRKGQERQALWDPNGGTVRLTRRVDGGGGGVRTALVNVDRYDLLSQPCACLIEDVPSAGRCLFRRPKSTEERDIQQFFEPKRNRSFPADEFVRDIDGYCALLVNLMYCICKRFGYYETIEWENALRRILRSRSKSEMNVLRANFLWWHLRLANEDAPARDLPALLGLRIPFPDRTACADGRGRRCNYFTGGCFCPDPVEEPWVLCAHHRRTTLAFGGAPPDDDPTPRTESPA